MTTSVIRSSWAKTCVASWRHLRTGAAGRASCSATPTGTYASLPMTSRPPLGTPPCSLSRWAKRETPFDGRAGARRDAARGRGALEHRAGSGRRHRKRPLRFRVRDYMRGVPYAHVATSLVAMVDAAIGGKTGVDLRGGKNLAGCFRDPIGVFCDVRAFRTLPKRAVAEGLAEIVKAAIIEGGDFCRARRARAASFCPVAVDQRDRMGDQGQDNDGCRRPRRKRPARTAQPRAHLCSRNRTCFKLFHDARCSGRGRFARGGIARVAYGSLQQAEHLRVLTLLTLPPASRCDLSRKPSLRQ